VKLHDHARVSITENQFAAVRPDENKRTVVDEVFEQKRKHHALPRQHRRTTYPRNGLHENQVPAASLPERGEMRQNIENTVIFWNFDTQGLFSPNWLRMPLDRAPADTYLTV
jgi:hypothetical protein